MDSENMSKWLTLGANIGILIGLALVVIQIRQNSDLLRLQFINDEYMTEYSSERLLIGENPADAIMKAMYSPEDMTYADFRVNDAYLVSKIDSMYRRYHLGQEGIFDEDDWRESNIGFTFEWLFGNRFSQLWWEHAGRGSYSDAPELVEYVDSKITSVSENRSTRSWETIRSELQADSKESRAVSTAPE
jgi:hypothetical protein